MLRPQKNIFFYHHFFATEFFNTVKLSAMANLFLKRASIPKTIMPFFKWGYRELF
jgi:hypothetical protein